MKVYSIGREIGCDIVLNDNSDIISRRHAVLNVMPSGKMTIVDQSHNGTYVNGMRISPNVPFPVTRKDSVSFAHVAPLDWNMVPKATGVIVRNILLALLALLLAGGIAWGIYALTNSNDSMGGFAGDGGGGTTTTVNNDSTSTTQPPQVQPDEEKARQDAQQDVQDSLKQQQQGTQTNQGRNGNTRRGGRQNLQQEKKKEDPEKEKKEDTQTSVIGGV